MILIMISIIRAITFHNEAVSFGQFLAVVEILILYYHQLFAFKCFRWQKIDSGVKYLSLCFLFINYVFWMRPKTARLRID